MKVVQHAWAASLASIQSVARHSNMMQAHSKQALRQGRAGARGGFARGAVRCCQAGEVACPAMLMECGQLQCRCRSCWPLHLSISCPPAAHTCEPPAINSLAPSAWWMRQCHLQPALGDEWSKDSWRKVAPQQAVDAAAAPQQRDLLTRQPLHAALTTDQSKLAAPWAASHPATHLCR